MSNSQTGFDAHDNGQPGPQRLTEQELAKLKENAEKVLKEYYEGIVGAFLREQHKKFFTLLEKAQKGYINFPDPASPEYLEILGDWVLVNSIHKKPAVMGQYYLDAESQCQIGSTYARLKDGVILDDEKAHTLAMAIYLNPNARYGVKVSGTPEEKKLLIEALDRIHALNPNGHKIRVLNRPLAERMPKPANAESKPLSLDETIQTLRQQNPETAHELWRIVKKAYLADTNQMEPQPDNDIQDEIERQEAHRKAVAAHDDTVKSDVKDYWDANVHMHAEYIKNAGGAIPMGSKPAQSADDNEVKPVNDIKDEKDLDTAFDGLAGDQMRSNEPSAMKPVQDNLVFKAMTEKPAQKTNSAPLPEAKKAFETGAKRKNGNGHDHTTNGNGTDQRPPVTDMEALMREARIHVIETQDTRQNGLSEFLGVGRARANTILTKLEEEGVVGPKENGRRRVPARSGRNGAGGIRQDIS